MTSYPSWLNRWQSRAERFSPAPLQLTIWITGGLVVFVGGGWPIVRWAALIGAGLFLAVCVNDLRRLQRFGVPTLLRRFQKPQQRIPFLMQADIDWPGQIPTLVAIDFGLPPTVTAAPHAPADLSITVRADNRGLILFSAVDLAWTSHLRLWRQMRRFPDTEAEVLVLPDVTTWRQDVIRVQSALLADGKHVKRYASGQSEFSHITEYTLEDDPRHINWSAAMRRRRLMTNVYQPERGQDVIIAIDTSRYMGVVLPDGKRRLDYAVETAAALSQTIWAAGDRVGLIAFANQVLHQIPPSNKKSHWPNLVQTLASLQAKAVQGGYHALFHSLSGRLERRSLIILLTELEGIVADTAFFEMQSTLARRHPVVVVTASDVTATAIAAAIPRNVRDWNEIAGAEWVLRDRRQTVAELSARGIDVVEAKPAELTVAAVRSYLDRKWRGR